MNESNRTVNATKNIASGIANKVISLLLVFIGRSIFIKYIGIEYLGINSLFSNVLSLLSMADLGFGVAMSYSFYKPLAEHDERKISALIHFYRKIYNYIALIILMIGISIIPFLKYIINMEKDIPYLQLYYIVFLLQTVVSYLFVYKSTIIVADQKNYVVNNTALYINIIRTIVQIVFILVSKNYLHYILIQLIFVLINNLYISYIANKLYPFIKSREALNKDEKKEIQKNIGSMFIYKMASTFMNSIDSIAISAFVGTVELGYYSNYLLISTNISMIVSIVFSSATAGIGNIIAGSEYAKRYQIFTTCQMISYFISSVVFTGFIFLAQDFISLWLGPQYILNNLVVFAIACDLYLGTSFQPLWSYREACGLYMKTKYIMVVAALLKIFISVALGKTLGIAGIVFASILCRLMTYFWYEPLVLYKCYFNKSAGDYFKDYLKNIIVLAVVTVLLSFINLKVIICDTWMMWMIKGIINVFCLCTVYYLIYHNHSDFRYLKQTVHRMVNKR